MTASSDIVGMYAPPAVQGPHTTDIWRWEGGREEEEERGSVCSSFVHILLSFIPMDGREEKREGGNEGGREGGR